MSKRKLSLKDLEISSFITSMEGNLEKTVQGGARGDGEAANSIVVCYANTLSPAGCFKDLTTTIVPPAPVFTANGCRTMAIGKAC